MLPKGEIGVVASLVKQVEILRRQMSELCKGMVLIQNQVTLIQMAMRPIKEVDDETPSDATVGGSIHVQLHVIRDSETHEGGPNATRERVEADQPPV